jgi:hypothetical protein
MEIIRALVAGPLENSIDGEHSLSNRETAASPCRRKSHLQCYRETAASLAMSSEIPFTMLP